ncbi:MAG: cell division protein FtsW [Kiritimatiellae bacterium]|nr:cell division protein FtsW [Kiritimatiellia bacterium]
MLGLVVAALVALGLVVLSSAGGANAVRLHGDQYFFMKRQFLYLGAGLLVAIFMAAFDYRRWKDNWIFSVLFYVAVFALLIFVFKFKAVNGSQRWIKLGPVNIQPSEFAKLATVIIVSVFLDKASWRVELFARGAFWPAVFIGLMALPIILEPDFGSTMVVVAAGFLIMIVAGVRILHLVPFAILGAGVFAYKVGTNANRMARLFAFTGWQPAVSGEAAKTVDAAAERAAYQARMSLVAIQRGGLKGVGLGNSMQKQYYLPEAHTDFIFAIGAEEFGLGFSLAVILLFVAFFALSVYIAAHARDRLGKFLVLGMAFVIFFQAAFNLGVVCEALPTKGMALPFFSYGGTNMISAFFAVGTIFSVGIRALAEEDTSAKRLREAIAKRNRR